LNSRSKTAQNFNFGEKFKISKEISNLFFKNFSRQFKLWHIILKSKTTILIGQNDGSKTKKQHATKNH